MEGIEECLKVEECLLKGESCAVGNGERREDGGGCSFVVREENREARRLEVCGGRLWRRVVRKMNSGSSFSFLFSFLFYARESYERGDVCVLAVTKKEDKILFFFS
ncbi:unnamed protein product [Lathyrus oleraceus]